MTVLKRMRIRLTEENALPAKRYIRGVKSLMDRSNALLDDGARRISADFRTAFNDILGLVPPTSSLTSDVVNGVILAARARAGDLAVEFGVVFRDIVVAQQQIIDDLYKLYGREMAPRLLIPTIGSDPELVAISASLSQQLIDSVTGSLTASTGRTLRLAALPPAQRGLSASNALHAALGDYRAWSARAERILRTEALRLASFASNQSFIALNELAGGNVGKMWVWSQIQRPEHAAISGQVRRANELFDVPLREGGTVQMRFPRDTAAIAYPSATINCQCFVVPFPIGTPPPPLA